MTKEKGRKLTMNELGRKTINEFQMASKIPIVLLLDDVRSLNNVGSVFRTSDAFAVRKVILCGITAQPPHREIEKTALGATESVGWEYSESCLDAAKKLQTSGYKVFGVEQVEGSDDLREVDLSKDSEIAVVFGNEVKGVSQSVLDICDGYLEIPQKGTKHSLNISVSVGIVLWELSQKLSQ